MRWVAPTPRKELKRKRVERWVHENGGIVTEDRAAKVVKNGAGKGSLFTPSGYRHGVELRPYDEVTFRAEFRGARPTPLSKAVALPGLRGDEPAIMDAERRLAPHADCTERVEIELVPIGAAMEIA